MRINNIRRAFFTSMHFYFRVLIVLASIIAIGFCSTSVFAANMGISDHYGVVNTFYVRETKGRSLSKPQNLRIVGIYLDFFDLEWQSVKGAEKYDILVKAPGQRAFKSVVTCKAVPHVKLSRCIQFHFLEGKKYYFKVRAYNSSGGYAISNAISAVCPHEHVNELRCHVDGKYVSLNMITDHEGRGRNNQQIARKTGNGKYQIITQTTGRYYYDTKTIGGKTYYYRYRMVYRDQNNKAFFGKWSNTVRAVTKKLNSQRCTFRALVLDTIYGNEQFRYYDESPLKAFLFKRGYKNVNVIENNDSGKSELKKKIASMFSGISDSDISLFYFVGHAEIPKGKSARGQEGAIIFPSEEKMSLKELASALKKVPGKVIIILDSCSSGSGIYANPAGAYNENGTSPNTSSVGVLRNKKFLVITSCAHGENSLFSREGFFTKLLLEGAGYSYQWHHEISGRMPADFNGDNSITLQEAYLYIRRKSQNWPQHAQVYPLISSQVIFRKR